MGRQGYTTTSPQSTSVESTDADDGDKSTKGPRHTRIGQSEFKVKKITDKAMLHQGNSGNVGPSDASSSFSASSKYCVDTAEGEAIVAQGNMSLDALSAFLKLREESWKRSRQTKSQSREESYAETAADGSTKRRLLGNRAPSPTRLKIDNVPRVVQGQVVIEVEEYCD